MANVKMLMSTDIAKQLAYILELYSAGRVRGIMIQTLLHDGDALSSTGGHMSFIEMVGLLESAKQDLFYSVEE